MMYLEHLPFPGEADARLSLENRDNLSPGYATNGNMCREVGGGATISLVDGCLDAVRLCGLKKLVRAFPN
jgi:hypothetical protein